MNSPISIGDLRTPIAYQEPVEIGRDANGGPLYSWETRWVGPALVRPLSAREIFYAGGQSAVVSHRVFMRWRPGVSPLGRIKLPGDRYIQLTAVLDLEERHQILDCQGIEMEAGG